MTTAYPRLTAAQYVTALPHAQQPLERQPKPNRPLADPPRCENLSRPAENPQSFLVLVVDTKQTFDMLRSGD
jgi:hypothetical protein